jgi:hypothetical protein
MSRKGQRLYDYMIRATRTRCKMNLTDSFDMYAHILCAEI